jgi:hypothetical protein
MKPISRVLTIFTVLLCISAHAETFASKEWAWSTDNPDFYFAATANGVGHILGQYCYFESGTCLYLVGIGINCEEGSQYPALINSDAGSAQVSLVCAYKYENQFVLFINSFDDVDRIIRAATRIGIAVPMQRDEFKVSRFGLAGSTYAIDLMRASAQDKMQRQPQNANTLLPEERI